MKYRALIPFAGIITMEKGEVRTLSDPAITRDLLRAGYIEEVKKEKPKKKKNEKRKEKKT